IFRDHATSYGRPRRVTPGGLGSDRRAAAPTGLTPGFAETAEVGLVRAGKTGSLGSRRLIAGFADGRWSRRACVTQEVSEVPVRLRVWFGRRRIHLKALV